MEAKKRICLILAALLGLSAVLPAAATDNQASDYLPLAVGNSWTYEHEYFDLDADFVTGYGSNMCLWVIAGSDYTASLIQTNPSPGGYRRHLGGIC